MQLNHYLPDQKPHTLLILYRSQASLLLSTMICQPLQCTFCTYVIFSPPPTVLLIFFLNLILQSLSDHILLSNTYFSSKSHNIPSSLFFHPLLVYLSSSLAFLHPFQILPNNIFISFFFSSSFPHPSSLSNSFPVLYCFPPIICYPLSSVPTPAPSTIISFDYHTSTACSTLLLP